MPLHSLTTLRLQKIPLDKIFIKCTANPCRTSHDRNTSSFQCFNLPSAYHTEIFYDLGLGITLSTSDNSSRMAHSFPGRSSDTSNESYNRFRNTAFLVILFQPLCGVFFLGSTAFATPHDPLSVISSHDHSPST